MPDRDVVLVTVDCWRADAVDEMPRLRAHADADGYGRSEAIAHSAATHGSFPALLASRYVVQAFDRDGTLRDDVTTLPEVLDANGYETAAILGSNPFLSRYEQAFDHFWNDGLTADRAGDDAWHSRLDQVRRFGTLRSRVPATDVADRAATWYDATDGPRFLWLHLMDAHAPYLPGFAGGLSVGLARTYATLYRYHVRGEDSAAVVRRLRALYDECVRRLDAVLPDLLSVVDDDALVVLTGDHGEEFVPGHHGHARLYDDCVRVPLFARGLERSLGPGPTRHLDLAPTLLEEIGLDVPDAWMGEPVDVDDDGRTALLFNHSPADRRSYLGARTHRHKYVESYHDERWTRLGTELYDLVADPGESEPVSDPDVAAELRDELESVLAREDVDLDLVRETTSGIDDAARDRLAELGYV